MHIYSNSFRGFSHVRNGKPCQDYSLSFSEPGRVIVACCDGHGGDRYIRSDRGSRFAGEAILEVFRRVEPASLSTFDKAKLDTIRMELLCAWNRRVEQDYSAHRFTKRELAPLSEEEREDLFLNKAKAYGTTMCGALLLGKVLILVSIGDGECLLVKKGEIEKPLEREEDPAANITYSMCQDDAYDFIRATAVDFRLYDAVLLCTDGFSGPFQSYVNLRSSFVNPLLFSSAKGKDLSYVERFAIELARSRGSGDDVSLAYILGDDIKSKYYR